MVTVLALLGVLAVLFAAAVLATSDRPVLADAPPDAADLPLPEEPLTPEDVSRLRFSMSARGYRMSEVDQALARLADELADRDRRIALLEAAAEGSAPAVPAAPEVKEPVAVREATVEDLAVAAPAPAVPAAPVAPAAAPPAPAPPAPPTVVPPAPAAPVAPAPVPLPDPPPAAPADAPNPAPADATEDATADPLPPADLGTELLTQERLEQPQQAQQPAPTDDEPRPPHP